tara:strand:+ start:79 stop:714 length:636 start_codon:yes stop_codon:yes gene_type:complete
MNHKLSKPLYWSKALKHLSINDPVLCSLITKHQSKSYLTCKNTIFVTLFKIIVGQQISIEVANSIEKKIIKKFGKVSFKKILVIDKDDLRDCGLSYRKIEYLKGIASKIKNDRKFFTRLDELSDNDAINELTSLYGIGQWSAEMFLIFHLNRMNILPLGDIGLINSFCKNYKVDKKIFLDQILKCKKKWEPYCTVATWFLWRDIDEDVVQY